MHQNAPVQEFEGKMKKEIEVCDDCEEEETIYKITAGSEKGKILCETCFEDWKERATEELIKNMFEEL